MLSEDQIGVVLELLTTHPIAALGTLHSDEPFVSMVPYAVSPAAGTLIIHVSSLATHTGDMLKAPAVSLMVMGAPDPQVPRRALPRITLQCRAEQCPTSAPQYDEARQHYLARFPETQELFGFGDFSLFVLTPRHMRFVGGFGQATSVMQPALGAILGRVASG